MGCGSSSYTSWTLKIANTAGVGGPDNQGSCRPRWARCWSGQGTFLSCCGSLERVPLVLKAKPLPLSPPLAEPKDPQPTVLGVPWPDIC